MGRIAIDINLSNCQIKLFRVDESESDDGRGHLTLYFSLVSDDMPGRWFLWKMSLFYPCPEERITVYDYVLVLAKKMDGTNVQIQDFSQFVNYRPFIKIKDCRGYAYKAHLQH